MEYGDMSMAANPSVSVGRLEAVLREAGDGLFALDRDRRIVAFSTGCERITGYTADEIVGRQCECHDVTECADADGQPIGALCPSVQVLNGEVPSARQRVQMRHKQGHQVWVESDYLPLRDLGGQVAGILCVVRDVTREVNETGRTEAEESPIGGVGVDAETGSSEGPNALDSILHRVERREILQALRRAHGQRSRAARALGISRSRLYRRMEALGIDPRVDV